MDNVIPSVLAAFLAWGSIYILLCLVWPSRSYEWHVRLVTTIHATLVTYISWICSYQYGPWPFTDPGGPNTEFHNVILIISLGYFLFDITWCLYFKTEGPAMMFHHIVSISGLSTTVVRGMYGCEIVAVIFGTEITNPLLQLRWFLRETGQYKTVLGELVDFIFMVLFGVMRLGIGSYLLYTYMTNPRTDYIGRSGGLMIYFVSWIFWVSIVQFAIRKYSKMWKEWGKSKSQTPCPKTEPVCDGACVQRVSQVIDNLTKPPIDEDTVEAIKNQSRPEDNIKKRSITT